MVVLQKKQPCLTFHLSYNLSTFSICQNIILLVQFLKKVRLTDEQSSLPLASYSQGEYRSMSARRIAELGENQSRKLCQSHHIPKSFTRETIYNLHSCQPSQSGWETPDKGSLFPLPLKRELQQRHFLMVTTDDRIRSVQAV